LNNDNIQFVRFPDDWMVQGRTNIARLGYTFVWKIPVDKIKEFCDQFETDSIPLAPEEGALPAGEPTQRINIIFR